MSCKDMVMTLGNDLSSEGGFSGNVNASIILKESSLPGDPSFVVEGHGNAFIS